MIFVDPSTGWLEIAEITDKISIRIVKYSTTLGYHSMQDLEKSFLTIGMSLRKISYFSPRTLALSPLLQPVRILLFVVLITIPCKQLLAN